MQILNTTTRPGRENGKTISRHTTWIELSKQTGNSLSRWPGYLGYIWDRIQVGLQSECWSPTGVWPIPRGAKRDTGHQQAQKLRTPRKARIDGIALGC